MARIPTIDEIKQWISDDELWRFYTCRAWRRKAKEIKLLDKNECQRCKKNGKYRKADMVHHVNPLREYPELALSDYYVDEYGLQKRQLISLCDDCHTLEHPDALKQNKVVVSKIDERWD